MRRTQSEQNAELISKAVGFVVINWAVAEQFLDHIVNLLWYDFEGAHYSKETKIPIFLSAKLKFVKNCVARNVALADLRCECDSLLGEFDRLGAVRNDLIHSAAHNLTPIDRSFVFAKIDVRNSLQHYRRVELNLDEYPKLVDELIELGRKAHGVAELLVSRADLNKDPLG